MRHLAKSVARPHPKPQNGSFLGPRLCWLGAQPSFCTKIGLFAVSDVFDSQKTAFFYGLGALRLKGLRAGNRVLGTENRGFLLGRARLRKPKPWFSGGQRRSDHSSPPNGPNWAGYQDLLFRVRCPKKDRPCATMDRNGSEWIGMEFRLGFTPPRRLRSIPIHCREGRSRNKPKGPESQKNSGTPIFAWVPGGPKIVQTDGPYVLETVEINGAWSKKA